MAELCFMLDLRDDPALIAEYEDWHRQVPTAVQDHLRRHGVLRLRLYRLGTRLCMLMDTDDGRFDPAAMAADAAGDAAVRAWEQLMWRFQQPTPWTPAGQKWTAARCICDLA